MFIPAELTHDQPGGHIQQILPLQHVLLGGLEHGVHAPDHAHGQDYIGIPAALEQIAQDIIGNAPDEENDFIVLCRVHWLPTLADRMPTVNKVGGRIRCLSISPALEKASQGLAGAVFGTLRSDKPCPIKGSINFSHNRSPRESMQVWGTEGL